MDFMKEYQKWLDSDVLTGEEKAELKAIANDPKEIESRFYGPLEFGTAGLRGTMAVGLHHMNIHVVRHTTQAFANVICAEGEKAKERGVAICMDCRLNGMDYSKGAAEVSTSPPAITPRSTTVTRSTGKTARSCPPTTPLPLPRSWRRSTSSPASNPCPTTRL